MQQNKKLSSTIVVVIGTTYVGFVDGLQLVVARSPESEPAAPQFGILMQIIHFHNYHSIDVNRTNLLAQPYTEFISLTASKFQMLYKFKDFFQASERESGKEREKRAK